MISNKVNTKQQQTDDFVRQFLKLLPDDLRHVRQDLEKNIRTALHAAFARMELITREEFDIQSDLLSRTRQLVEELEEKVTVLERKLDGRN